MSTSFMDKPALKLAQAAGIEPFQPILHAGGGQSKLVYLVTNLLSGRTHFFDEVSMKALHSKVHEVDVFASRFVLGIVESIDFGDGRKHRAILFRADGEVIYQTPDDQRLSRHAASVELRYQGAILEPRKVLEDAIRHKLKEKQAEVKALEVALHRLPTLAPP